MNAKPDALFGIHTQALDVWQKRAQVIANNLANADTPGYQARDIDFRKVLAAQSHGQSDGTLPLETDQPGQIGANPASGADALPLSYRTPMQPSMDGNTVDEQAEQSAFAQNAVHYSASLGFISGQIQTLRLAITGSGN